MMLSTNILSLTGQPIKGDHIGKYLDLGVWGTWNFGSKHVFMDQPDAPYLGASKSKIILRKLNYVSDLN